MASTLDEIPELIELATFEPPGADRAWQSAPHPYLPLIATASSDKTVRVYSLTSFTLLSTITGGHRRSVRACAWRPGVKGDAESVLATGSFDACAAIWNGRNDVVGRSRGTEAADGGDDEAEDDDEWRFAVVLEGHDSEIKSVTWSAHGTFLATCSRDKSVWIWEALDEDAGGGGVNMGQEEDDDDNYETVAVLQEHEGDVKCVKFHPEDETCLASGSYDDNVRVWRADIDGEWTCVGLLEGHKGTVWSLDWEPVGVEGGLRDTDQIIPDEDEGKEVSGPRIISCSDDLTIRLWRRKPKARRKAAAGPRIPSIIRSTSDEEDWFEETQLPQGHDRAIYSLDWSSRSKRVVSAGSDGKIVVYEEMPREGVDNDTVMADSGVVASTNGDVPGDEAPPTALQTTWKMVGEIEAAHGVYEVNHVCWAKRYDKEKTKDDEEIIISTADNGEVKAWALNNIKHN